VLEKNPNALDNHKNWRNSLQVGDTIDAIKENIITMSGEKSKAYCQGWTRAKIILINESEEDDNGIEYTEEDRQQKLETDT
jgi:hypothetical protein